MRRVGIFGWGIVAPQSPNIDAFARNLAAGGSWLEPFEGFGPANFLVGNPSFDFAQYRDWVIERFKPNRFSQLESKMGSGVQYAIGAFVQALGQNPGLEEALQELGKRTHVYVGTGLGDLDVQYRESVAFYKAHRRWNRFWASAERNAARRAFEAGEELSEADRHGAPALVETAVPPRPETVDIDDRDEAESLWWQFWADHCPALRQYLATQREVESAGVEGDIESGKLSLMKEKQRGLRRLRQEWNAPTPPWEAVSANLLWNIDNIAAAQISMLGGFHGPTFAVGAACSTFGVSLKLAIDAIRRDEADAVVVGATDPAPHPLSVGGFYAARVIPADGGLSKPLTQLRGTHIAGGAAVWIVADLDSFRARGFRALGMEPLAVAVTSDADHIITPSREGPLAAMRDALDGAGAAPAEVKSWDLHATATPGDFNEVEMVHDLLGDEVLVSARKGTFGHGMSVSGGWELTAQYLGFESGQLAPTPLASDEMHPEIAQVHSRFLFDTGCAPPAGIVGKLSMGVGGINACIVSRPLDAPQDDA